MAAAVQSSEVAGRQRGLLRFVTVSACASAAAAAVGAGAFAAAGRSQGLVLFLGFPLLVVLWRWRTASLVVLAAIATFVEWLPTRVFDALGIHIPLYVSLAEAYGLPGLSILPVELIMLAAIAIWVLRSSAAGTLRLPSSPVARALLVLVAWILFSEIMGVARGGDFRISIREIRPLLYVAILYLLASQLAGSPSALRGLLWTMVLGIGLKGVQGTFAFYGLKTSSSLILEHDESFFFGVFLLATATMWLFQLRGPLRRVATLLAPFVLVANFANGRRTSWLIIGSGLIVLFSVGWVVLPRRRGLILLLVGALAAAMSVYLPLYWNGHGSTAQPARAIRSAIQPDKRDAESDQYRLVENANLGIAIRKQPLLGEGFGLKVPVTIENVDIKRYDPSIEFIPHNGILDLWLRTGTIGQVLFWVFIGTVMLAAGRVARSADRLGAGYATVAMGSVMGYVILAYYDLGIVSMRIGILLGLILGTLEAMRARQEAKLSAPARETGASRNRAGEDGPIVVPA